MDLMNLRKTLKKYDILFSTFRKITDSAYRQNYWDYLSNSKVKPGKTIKKELSLIKDYWGCDPMIYFKYRLFEKDLTDEQLLDYIPPYYFYNIYLPGVYPDGKAFEIAKSKIRQNDFFALKGIDSPLKIAKVQSGVVYDNSGQSCTFERFVSLLKESDAKTFFMKPDDGRGGTGITRIEKNEGKISVGNNILDKQLFIKLTGKSDFIIQEGIVQRADFMSIYPHSVNTLRTVTQNFDGNPKIIAVVLRMGRNGLFVDNASTGGIFAFIDHETGLLSAEAHGLYDKKSYKIHPDTGFRFEGYRIPGWENIRQSILSVAALTPELPDVAWDITVTEQGIKVVEMNLYYGIDLLQRSFGGMRRRLNVTPPVIV